MDAFDVTRTPRRTLGRNHGENARKFRGGDDAARANDEETTSPSTVTEKVGKNRLKGAPKNERETNGGRQKS